ncbi:hypothetical protein IEQ34_005641 [Dendrobium chrysotoxum]|uniref:Uncharacterized protein n=1 Tax=Dendrobium chrysotoxum TaxID=161865 RepID=A0AAV7HC01_DENCH|nr:hypothetical protein IEQ34_005641 [Dendrobium chrysotoxum]
MKKKKVPGGRNPRPLDPCGEFYFRLSVPADDTLESIGARVAGVLFCEMVRRRETKEGGEDGES